MYTELFTPRTLGSRISIWDRNGSQAALKGVLWESMGSIEEHRGAAQWKPDLAAHFPAIAAHLAVVIEEWGA